jgi:hypothetical protein
MRKGSGIGFIVLLIALAIVMILTARNWKSVAPTAMEIAGEDGPQVLDDHGQSDAAAELQSGDLPRLGEMQAETAEHAEAVREALEASNQ